MSYRQIDKSFISYVCWHTIRLLIREYDKIARIMYMHYMYIHCMYINVHMYTIRYSRKSLIRASPKTNFEICYKPTWNFASLRQWVVRKFWFSEHLLRWIKLNREREREPTVFKVYYHSERNALGKHAITI